MERNKNLDSTYAKKAEEDEVMRRKKGKKWENAAVVLPDLPFVISEILSRVPIEAIVRWRCVRRSWRDLIIDPYFMQLQLSKYYDVFQSRPYVLSATELLLVTKMNDTWRGLNIPIRRNISSSWVFVASCSGLILLLQHEEDLHYIVYNPITKESMRLPDLNIPTEASKTLRDMITGTTQENRWRLPIDTLGFGFDQKNIKYKVIFNHRTSPAIITLGDNSWRNLAIPKEKISSFCERMRKPIFFNGSFHWIFHCGCGSRDSRRVQGILKLDISTEKFQTISFSPPLNIDKPLVQPSQFGNSVAFIHQKEGFIKIWRILGKNSDGSCYHQFKTVQVPINRIPIPFTNTSTLNLVAALSNGDFLFRAWNDSYDCLFVYDQEKDEVVVI